MHLINIYKHKEKQLQQKDMKWNIRNTGGGILSELFWLLLCLSAGLILIRTDQAWAQLNWMNEVLCWLCVDLRLIARLQWYVCSSCVDTRSAQLRPFASQVIWQWGDMPTNLLLTVLFFPLTASEYGRGWRQPLRVSQSHAAPTIHQSGKPLLIGYHQWWRTAHRPQQLLWHARREWVLFGWTDHHRNTAEMRKYKLYEDFIRLKYTLLKLVRVSLVLHLIIYSVSYLNFYFVFL